MNLYSLLLYTSFIIFIYLGVTVLGKKARSRLTLIFCLLCFAFAYWSLCITFLFPAPTKEAAFFWIKASAPAWAMIPALFLHFTLLLTGRLQTHNYNPAPYLIYLPGVLFAWREITSHLIVIDFSLESYGWNGLPPLDSNWFFAFNAYYLGFVILAVLLLEDWRKKSAVRRQNKQAVIVILTVLITLLLTFLNETLLPGWGITQVPKIPSFTSLIWAFGMWYAISRYRLMELTPALAADEILSNIQDLLFLTDSRGRIAHMNSRVEAILRYSPEELMDRPVHTIFPESEARRLQDDFQRMAAAEFSSLQRELEINTRDGSLYPFRLFITAVRDREEALVGIALVAQDLRETRQLQQVIIEREKVEEELRQSNEKLKELDQVKTETLYMVTHDLRTPMTSIVGFSHLISKKYTSILLPVLEDLDDKKINRAAGQILANLKIIQEEGQRLTKLINDFLDLSKLETGKVTFEREPLNIEKIIESSLNSLQSMFKQKNLQSMLNVEPALPEIIGDRDKLIQVMLNLLSNAIKFTAEGSVTCRAFKQGDELIVSVIDTGRGIPPEAREHVFEKFKQVGKDDGTVQKGTGLGLPICRQIIEQHGGRIWVESEAGEGSTFSFNLPLTGVQDA